MKIQKAKLLEVISQMTITNQFDFKGNYIDLEGETHLMTIFTTNYFLTNLRHRYFNRELFIDTDAPDTDLLNIFTTWMQSRGALYAKQAYAYTLAYNPIENYLSNEHTEGTVGLEHGEKIEREGGQTVTTTHTNDQVATTYNQLTDDTTHSKYGLNSANAVPADKDTNVRTGSETATHTGSVSNAKKGTDTDTHSGTDTTTTNMTTTRHGNIGVQTAAEMLQREYDGLMQDLADLAMREFLQKYTFYSGEVDT